MKEMHLTPGELVYSRGVKDPRVYFLVSGELDYIMGIDHDPSLTFSVSKAGTTVGLRGALIESERSMTVRCHKDSNSTLVYFEIDDFKKILSRFPKDYERFCELRDDILLNGYTLDISCSSCKRYDHTITRCPLITTILPVA